MTKKFIALLAILLQLTPAWAGLPPTTASVAGGSDFTTFKYKFPNFTGTQTGTSFSLGVNSIAGGGTGVTSATSAPTASSFAAWDSNSNLSANSLLDGYATTVTSAGTLTLTVASKKQQYLTGVTTHTVVLPVASTMALGQSFLIVNNSTGNVTVQSSGSNTIQVMAAGTQLLVTNILTSGTTAASWNASYQIINSTLAGVSPTVTTYTVAGSGTFTTPAGAQYLRVRVLGGGGGGAGGVSADGTNGNPSSFGSIITCTGGLKGVSGSSTFGGAGGTATITTSASVLQVLARSGQYGLSSQQSATAGTYLVGGGGGGAGGGSGGPGNGSGRPGITNTGGGGGGGGSPSANIAGSGGGEGAEAIALITSPLASYSYTVAATATGGSGTTAGGTGAEGFIEITVYYSAVAVGTSVAVTANTVMAGPSSGSAATPAFRSLVPNDTTSVFSAATGAPPTGTLAASINIIKYGTVESDTTGAYNSSTGQFTCASAGVVHIDAAYAMSGTFGAGSATFIGIYIGGVQKRLITLRPSATLATTRSFQISGSYRCAASDTIDIRSYTEATAGPAYTSVAADNYFNIFKVGS